jgi:hypothetical protein
MRWKITGTISVLAVFGGILGTACSPATSHPVTVTTTAPPMPAAAREDSRQGATYYASHWVDLLDYVRRTLDAGPLRPLGLPSCHTCTDLITQLDHDKAAGLRYNGGGIHLLSSDPTDYQQGKSAVVNVQFEEGEMQVINQAGTIVETVPPDTIIFNFNLTWTDGDGWRAATIKLAEVPPAKPTS